MGGTAQVTVTECHSNLVKLAVSAGAVAVLVVLVALFGVELITGGGWPG